MLTNLAAIIAAYFIGALPHLYVLCKLRRISTTGDLHINLWQGAGPFWGLAAVLFDVLKGAAAVWMGHLLGLDLAIIVACGLAAVAGQMWPVFARFDGEKGNTTGLGMALALAWPATLAALVPALFGLVSKLVRLLKIKNQPLRKRFKSGAGQSDALPVGVALTLLILPVAAWLMGEPVEVVYGFVALLVIIMLRRLTQGLSKDIKERRDLKRALFNRLLYDRSRH
ncbi:MAG: glycerol-3-phosphate acyltransferase [Dehalococcoidaceae bacterium]|nr:glycerol-3-phosphate acyltransferase [Dehalococcoidaceae bacterium]